MPENKHSEITAVEVDMSPAFILTIKSVFPNAAIVHDKYHVVSYLTKAVDNVLKRKMHCRKKGIMYLRVRVLDDYNGPSMAKRFMNYLTLLHFPKFDDEKVSIAYIPKEKIALKKLNGSYKPNQALLDLIPTPSVIEIVRDVKKWNIGN